MANSTFTVLFYVKRTKLLRDGTIPVFARITINGNRCEFGLKKSILPVQWNQDAGRAIGQSKEAKELNAYIDVVKGNLMLKRRELEEQGKQLTAISLRNAYLGVDENNRTILEVFDEHNEKCEKLKNLDYAPGTVERYQTCRKHIHDFIRFRYRKDDAQLYEVTPMFISDFEFYLKTERKCCHNTATKYIKNFKKITRIALANGWMKADPFVNVKFHLDDVDMDFLTEEELNVMIKKEFTMERLQQVKDIYLFCCFTGLAFIDVKSLKYSDIEYKDGSPWIKKRRQKTKNWCHIPVLEPAQHLMDRYKNHPACVRGGFVLPVLTNQKMNSYLKEIADVCGIQKHLSTHTARHTFATTVTLANQISIEVVSKMLGHSSINMTKKYARVVDDLIKRDMQKLVGKYDGLIKE